MASYADLQNRVAGELNRFDLLTPIPPNPSAVIPTYIQDRISYYQKSLFAPSQQIITGITAIAGQHTYPLPPGLESIEFIRFNIGGVWLVLERKTLESILATDVVNPPFRTQPWCFAQYGRMFRLFATPDQAYPLEIMGSLAPPAPVAPDDDNFWTNVNSDGAGILIVMSACAEITRRIIHDFERANQWEAMVQQRESVSLHEQADRLDGPGCLTPYLPR